MNHTNTVMLIYSSVLYKKHPMLILFDSNCDFVMIDWSSFGLLDNLFQRLGYKEIERSCYKRQEVQ